ncbi:VTC domain-containing protein [Algibacter aquimarinus]|uniref:Polyphosphate polymerase domain-containing protein n=1 Tax=Algibacter aquimarinus TaxID=1136748 RepID=A0ABP9HQU6_9FLAO
MEYRYERKMFIENISRKEVEIYVKNHPAFFREIFYARNINNVYFDFIDLINFQDNIIGNVDRLKYRIRWYGDLFTEIENARLELKIKKGHVGTKKMFPLKNFKFCKGISGSDLIKVISNSSVDELVKLKVESQKPVVLNRYKRTYYESLDKKFRITIDDEQMFCKINTFQNTFLNRIIDNDNVVLELKYNKSHDLEAQSILNKIPFRISKSSKYSRGVELFYV